MSHFSILSSKNQAYLIRAIKSASSLGCLAFKWNETLEKLELRGRWPRLAVKISAINSFFLPVYETTRLLYWFLYQRQDVQHVRSGMVLTFATLMFLFGTTTLYHVRRHHDEHFRFLQTSLTFFSGVSRNFGLPVPEKLKNGCEKYLRGFFIGSRMNVIAFGTVLFVKPERIHTFMSLFTNPKKQPFFVPVTLVNFYLVVLCGVMTQYCMAIPIIYAFAMHTVIKQCKIAGKTGVMSQEEFMLLYRSSQLLQKQFNVLFGTWLLPVQENLFISGAVIGIYGVVHMERGLRIVYGILAMLAFTHLSFAYIEMGQLNNDSKELLEGAKSRGTRNRFGQGKWFCKFLASCKPITVTHGTLFYVDKGLILTIWMTIVSGAINVLVTMR